MKGIVMCSAEINQCVRPAWSYYSRTGDVKRALPGTLLSTAEHEYTRYGFRRLLSDRSVDIIQPDVACRVEIKLRCQRHA
jgi:L-alanine-DL-glutamate epimerase-like enolase superfamily enzyme